jgi:hypothetical protein
MRAWSWKRWLTIGVFGALVAAVVGGGGYVWWLERQLARNGALAVAGTPPGWMDSIRAVRALPAEVERLALPLTEDGDATPLLLGSAHSFDWGLAMPAQTVYNGLVLRHQVSPADSMHWKAIALDTTLERYVRAARQRRYQPLETLLARSDSGARHNFFAMAVPRFAQTKGVAYGLAVRSRWRRAHVDRRGADQDVAAILRLGAQLYRRDPTLIGCLVGQSMIGIGAVELPSGPAVGEIGNWMRRARRASEYSRLLQLFPDTAVAVAADTAMPLGWRTEALASLVYGDLIHPRQALFGLSRATAARLEPFTKDPDPQMAQTAALVLATWHWVDGLGPRGRWRLMRAAVPPLQ